MSSVVAATTPIVAQYVAEKNFDGMKRTVRNGIQVLVFISLPVCAWLAFTGDSLISLLFERGQFSRPDVLLTSSLMALMTPYILFSRAVSISQTPFYAVKDTKTLGLSMVLSFLLYATMISPLLHWYGVYGFPLAISLSAALGVLVMCVFMHRSFGSMGWSKLQTFGVRMAGVVAAMMAALMVAGRFEVHAAAARITDKLFAIGIPSAFAMVAFLGTAVALRVISSTDISQGLNFLRRKLSV